MSKAGYYAWRERKPSTRARTDAALTKKVIAIHRKSRGRYGSPMIHAQLQQKGIAIARKRVARLMKEAQIQGKRRRGPRKTTASAAPTFSIAPNLLNRQFSTVAPNVVWVSDITYFSTREGWLYLAVVLDLFSRRIVGWSMHKWRDAALVIAALRMAVKGRQPKRGLIVHSDQGSQYGCNDYINFVKAHGIVRSMSRKGDCWDNAVVESFFASLKADLKRERIWASRAEARTAIFEYLEAWYNRARLHSTLGYVTPIDFEATRVA